MDTVPDVGRVSDAWCRVTLCPEKVQMTVSTPLRQAFLSWNFVAKALGGTQEAESADQQNEMAAEFKLIPKRHASMIGTANSHQRCTVCHLCDFCLRANPHESGMAPL